MKFIILIFLFHFIFAEWLPVDAQAPLIEWQKCLGGQTQAATTYTNFFGDIGKCVQPTSDGGCIVAGYSYSIDGDISLNHGSCDVWIVKLDRAGNTEWKKSFGGSAMDQANSIVATRDGGYIVAGTTTSVDGDVTSQDSTFADYWVIKLDHQGNMEWQKTYGGSDTDAGACIKQTIDGGYIMTGHTFSADRDITNYNTTGRNSDFWVVKISATGNLQWQKRLGSPRNDRSYSIDQTADGGYIVAGAVEENGANVTGNHNSPDAWLVKLNSSGEIEWQKALGGGNIEVAYAVAQTPDGGYIMTGFTNSFDGDVSNIHVSDTAFTTDCWLVKLNQSGDIEWQRCLGGKGDETGYGLINNGNGGFLIAAVSNSTDGNVSDNHNRSRDYWIVNVSEAGDIIWQKSYGGNGDDTPYSIALTQDAGIVVAGYSGSGSNDGDVSNPHYGTNDYWILKLGHAPCQPSVSISTSSAAVCTGAAVTFNATVTNGGTNPGFQWKINGIPGGTNSNVYTNSNFQNNDSIFCIVTSNEACAAISPEATSNSIRMKVAATLTPLINITTASNEICRGTNVTINTSSQNEGPAPVYQWKINGLAVGRNEASYSSATFVNSDRISCELINSAGCGTANPAVSNIIQLSVHDSPSVKISPADTIVNPGSQIQLNAVISNGATAFEWIPAGDLINPFSLNTNTFPLYKNSAYTLIVTNEKGCVSKKTISVKLPEKILLPGSFTPNGDGINDLFKIPPGCNLHLNNFSVFDRWGNRVFSTADISQGWDGSLNGVPKETGTYVYVIQANTGIKNIVLKGIVTLLR